MCEATRGWVVSAVVLACCWCRIRGRRADETHLLPLTCSAARRAFLLAILDTEKTSTTPFRWLPLILSLATFVISLGTHGTFGYNTPHEACVSRPTRRGISSAPYFAITSASKVSVLWLSLLVNSPHADLRAFLAARSKSAIQEFLGLSAAAGRICVLIGCVCSIDSLIFTVFWGGSRWVCRDVIPDRHFGATTGHNAFTLQSSFSYTTIWPASRF